MQNLLRDRSQHDARVSSVELFFDLVFVFAITQLSHRLLADFTVIGVLQSTILFLGVWWVWIYTAWVTNWLDPERIPVRVLLFVLMVAGLFVSMAIPDAFGQRGLIFASAYVAMQVGRSLFMLAALYGRDANNFRNFQRITLWLATSGLFWLAGGLSEEGGRLILWSIALLLEYMGPSLGFRVPGLGRSSTLDWNVEGHHLAERCGLFIIIALGESILVTGATFATTQWDAATTGAFAAAVSSSIAMWWIYFNIGAERATHKIALSEDPGRLARLAYTYIHLFIVAGIIVSAASDELVLAHPTGHIPTATATAVLAAAATFLAGNLLFKRATYHLWPFSHLVGLALLAVLACTIQWLTPVLLSLCASAILVIVAVWETRSLRGRSKRLAEV